MPMSAAGPGLASEMERRRMPTDPPVEDDAVRVDDVMDGWVHVRGPAAQVSRKDNEVAVLLIPKLAQQPLTSLKIVDTARSCLRAGKRGRMFVVPRPADPASVEVCRIRGASLEAYIQAARRAASHGQALVLVTTTGRLDATGIDTGELELQHPHVFHTHQIELWPDENSTAAPTAAHVVVPIVEPIQLPSPHGSVLKTALDAFFDRRDVGVKPTSSPGGAMSSLEPATAAYLRMQRVISKHISTGLGPYAPFPMPAALLHSELQWHLVEHHLGSLLQVIPETELMRFGDNLLLPVSNEFLSSTLIPLLRLFAEAHAEKCFSMRRWGRTGALRKAAEVPLVEFFAWTWDRAVKHAAADGERHAVLQLHRRRIGSLSSYEGYLAKWCLYVPHAMQLRNRNGLMCASFWWST